MRALSTCCNLHRVYLSGITDIAYIPALCDLAKSRTLEKIHFGGKHNGQPSRTANGITYDYSFDDVIAADGQLNALCVYETHE